MGDIIHFLCRMRLKIDLLLFVILVAVGYVSSGTESTWIRTARASLLLSLLRFYVDVCGAQASTRDQCNRLDRCLYVFNRYVGFDMSCLLVVQYV